jgi:hypothetical protein
MMKLAKIKEALRSGPYAWPGAYPLYFVTTDGGALSFKTVRQEWRCIVDAHLRRDQRCGWAIEAVDINWECPDLYDDHTGERIESAYAEED